MVTMAVVAPSPSRETISATIAVPRATLRGSPPTAFNTRRTSGSNRPASIMIPK